MRALVISLALVTATPVLACINDRSVELDEEQFRSNYGEEAEAPAEEPSMVTASIAGGGVAGLLLLGSALYLARRTSRA